VVLFFSFLGGGCGAPVVDGLRDQVGTSIPPGLAQRVVALAPDVTEIVFALSAADRLVAVAETADYPAAASRLPRVDSTSVEAILAHHPDLVLATTAGNDPRTVSLLSSLGIRTCTVDPSSLERIAEGFRLIAEVLGIPDRGGELADSFRRRVQAASSRVRALTPKGGLYIVWWEPLIVAGPGTFHHDLLAAAGIVNLAPGGAGRYPRLNPELLLDHRLEVVVVPDDEDSRTGFARVAAAPVGRRLTSGQVALLWLPADPASRPGPRVADALEELVEKRLAGELALARPLNQGFVPRLSTPGASVP
jgi:ABC-type Fe3+-hydroxamate transport system substrate-binding protein